MLKQLIWFVVEIIIIASLGKVAVVNLFKPYKIIKNGSVQKNKTNLTIKISAIVLFIAIATNIIFSFSFFMDIPYVLSEENNMSPIVKEISALFVLVADIMMIIYFQHLLNGKCDTNKSVYSFRIMRTIYNLSLACLNWLILLGSMIIIGGIFGVCNQIIRNIWTIVFSLILVFLFIVYIGGVPQFIVKKDKFIYQTYYKELRGDIKDINGVKIFKNAILIDINQDMIILPSIYMEQHKSFKERLLYDLSKMSNIKIVEIDELYEDKKE